MIPSQSLTPDRSWTLVVPDLTYTVHQHVHMYIQASTPFCVYFHTGPGAMWHGCCTVPPGAISGVKEPYDCDVILLSLIRLIMYTAVQPLQICDRKFSEVHLARQLLWHSVFTVSNFGHDFIADPSSGAYNATQTEPLVGWGSLPFHTLSSSSVFQYLFVSKRALVFFNFSRYLLSINLHDNC